MVIHKSFPSLLNMCIKAIEYEDLFRHFDVFLLGRFDLKIYARTSHPSIYRTFHFFFLIFKILIGKVFFNILSVTLSIFL